MKNRPSTLERPSPERLCAVIDAMAGRPVVMLVDLVADRFITGVPKRVSREAPVLILEFESETLTPGGGANALANVSSLGGVPLGIGILGDDAHGTSLLEALTALGIETGGLIQRPGYRTPTKTRILGGGRHSIKQQIVRYDIEEKLVLGPEDLTRLEGALERFHGQASVAVLSDYGYGTVAPTLLEPVRKALGASGQVLVDSRYRLGDFKGLDGATPNEEEAEAMLGGPLGDDMSRLEEGGRKLLEELEAAFLLVTRGSRGMSLFAEGRACHIPVFGTDQVADVTGAGDTVIGTFALALAAGATPLEASLLANYAGGIVVMKMGTATLDREELRAAVQTRPTWLEGISWVKW